MKSYFLQEYVIFTFWIIVQIIWLGFATGPVTRLLQKNSWMRPMNCIGCRAPGLRGGARHNVDFPGSNCQGMHSIFGSYRFSFKVLSLNLTAAQTWTRRLNWYIHGSHCAGIATVEGYRKSEMYLKSESEIALLYYRTKEHHAIMMFFGRKWP